MHEAYLGFRSRLQVSNPFDMGPHLLALVP